MTKLSLIAEINPKLNARLADEDSVSFLGMADVSELGVTTRGEPRRYRDVAKGYTPFRRGDVLVAKITPCFQNGKIAQADTEHEFAFGSTEFHVIRPDVAVADPRYVLHFLRTPDLREAGERRMTGSGGQRRVPRGYLDDVDVPLPPIREQRRIAAILDQVDELRAKRRRTLALLRELLRARVGVFMADTDAEPTPLGDVLSLPLRNGVSPSTLGTHRARVLTLSAVTGGSFDIGHSREAEFDTSPPPQKYVSAQDFLICRGNGNRDLVGQGVLVPDVPRLAVLFPDTVIAVKLDQDRVVPEFFAAQWATALIRRQIRAISRTTNGTFKVNQTGLAKVVIQIPGLRAQQKFVAEATKIEDAIAKSEAHLTHLDELFASLQHRAFTGQL